MGIIESWMKRPRASDEHLAELFAPGAETRLLERAQLLDDRGDHLDATQLLRAGTVRYYPWNEGEAALDRYQRSRARASLASLQDAVESRYSAADAAHLSAALNRLGDASGATSWAHAAIEEDPCNPEGYLAIARGFLRRFRREDDSVAGLHALRYLSKACQLHPGHGECLRALAMLLLLLRAPVAASKVLRPISRISPSDPMVLALNALTKFLPDENTTNVQELFLRWETGSIPTNDETSRQLISAPGEFDVWEVDASRSLVACSDGADHGQQMTETLSVLTGSLYQATPRMGLGEFSKFTARGAGGVLIGLAESGSLIVSHCKRQSLESSLARWLESDRGRETIR